MRGTLQDKDRLEEQNLEKAQENLSAHGWDMWYIVDTSLRKTLIFRN